VKYIASPIREYAEAGATGEQVASKRATCIIDSYTCITSHKHNLHMYHICHTKVILHSSFLNVHTKEYEHVSIYNKQKYLSISQYIRMFVNFL